MQYRWNKSELYFKYLLSYIYRNPNYRFTIASLLKQYDLSHPKSHIEKYSLNEIECDFQLKKEYFYDCLQLVSEDVILKCQNIYCEFEDVNYFKQDFKMPKRFFTVKELMRMLDDVIENINNPDIARIYRDLSYPQKHTFNIQKGIKNSRGELSISGMTIYDCLFHKNYINILREYNAQDFVTLTHETMHAIFNGLLYENGISYEDQLLFTELEGYFGSLVASEYLDEIGYHQDARISRASILDSILFLSLALIIGDIISSSSNDQIDISKAIKNAELILPQDRFIDFRQDYESYMIFPAFDIIIDIIDYASALELTTRPMNTTIKSIIDIKLHNNNDLEESLKRHNISSLNDNFAILKKEFTRIK